MSAVPEDDEIKKLRAETAKLNAEADKLEAEQRKLLYEALKFRKESDWYPFVAGAGVTAGFFTAVIALAAALAKYFH